VKHLMNDVYEDRLRMQPLFQGVAELHPAAWRLYWLGHQPGSEAHTAVHREIEGDGSPWWES